MDYKVIEKLLDLSTKATPPPWYSKPNDIIGGHCIMPVDETPYNTRENSIADFGDKSNTDLMAFMRTNLPEIIMMVSMLKEVREYLIEKPKPFSLINLELMLDISLYKVYGDVKYCRWCGYEQPDGVEGYHITQCPTKDVSLF